jgi:hypothetical protein
MLLELRRLEVPPGQKLLLRDVTWEEFETIVEELGEHRGSRLAYAHGVLEIITPLAEHVEVPESPTFPGLPCAPSFPSIWRRARSRGEIPPSKPFGNGCGRAAVSDTRSGPPSVSRAALRANSTGAYLPLKVSREVGASAA